MVNLTVDPKERRPIDVPYVHSWTAVHFGRILKEFESGLQLRARRSATFRPDADRPGGHAQSTLEINLLTQRLNP